MVFARTSMTGKEMYEGYKANIPSEIMEKMGSGFVLTDKEKEIVRKHGKVYVLGYIKRKDGELIKPQLRDLPKGRRSNPKNDRINGKVYDLDLPSGWEKVRAKKDVWGETFSYSGGDTIRGVPDSKLIISLRDDQWRVFYKSRLRDERIIKEFKKKEDAGRFAQNILNNL